MKLEIDFISDSWKLLFFAEARIRTFHFGIKNYKVSLLFLSGTHVTQPGYSMTIFQVTKVSLHLFYLPIR